MTTVEYWDKVYSGRSTEQPGSGGSAVDRYAIVMEHLEGFMILDVAAGYGDLCRRIKSERHGVVAVALDFSPEAKRRSVFSPYVLAPATDMPFLAKEFDLVLCTQGMGYMGDPEAFLLEAARIGKKLILTVSNGRPEAGVRWEYTEDTLRELLERHGKIEQLCQTPPAMLFAKVAFR
jgi:ubiquinone/menaquinone biosynthesis C-methylase UbiE